MYGTKDKSINSIINDFLTKKEEPKKEEPVMTESDGKVMRYPRKKRKLKQKDLFVSMTKKKP
tara:strand:+ start:572 stop:757 length:186 start_codon:yes stop_codon:yes gene_type:complete